MVYIHEHSCDSQWFSVEKVSYTLYISYIPFAKNLLCFIKKGYFLRVQSASKTLIGNRGFITHLYAFSNINVPFANSTEITQILG